MGLSWKHLKFYGLLRLRLGCEIKFNLPQEITFPEIFLFINHTFFVYLVNLIKLECGERVESSPLKFIEQLILDSLLSDVSKKKFATFFSKHERDMMMTLLQIFNLFFLFRFK
jgi:hypothetical protein